MAEQLLHGAQVSAAVEQMARERVAQNVGRHARRVEPGLGRDILQFDGERLPRHMPLGGPRRE